MKKTLFLATLVTVLSLLVNLPSLAVIPFKFQLSNGSTLTNWGRGIVFDRNGFTASVVNGTISLDTVASGTVTSVGLNNGDSYSTITSSPVTTSGTINIGINASTIYSGTIFNGDFAERTTTNLTEGTNLYYTAARANGDALQVGTEQGWSAEDNGGTMRSIQFSGDNGVSFNVASLSGNGGALRATFDSSLISGGTPGGSNTQLQFNDSSAFSGNGDLTFTKGTRTLALATGAVVDINSTTLSIADTNITLDGATTTFTQTGATGTITMSPKAGANFVVQQSTNGKTLIDNSTGSVIAILDSTSAYGDPSVTSVFGDAVIQFKENGQMQWAMGFHANGDQFRIDDTHALANGRFVIKNDGNVGIGDTTPSYKLDVAGTINATGNITGANLSGTNTGNQTIQLTGDVTGSGTGTFAATVASQTSANWATKISDEVGTGRLVFNGSTTLASPTLITPALGAATGTSLVTTGKVVAGTNINGTTANVTKILSSGNVNGTTANFTKILDSGTLNGVSLNISNGAAFTQVKNLGNGGTTEAFDFTKANKFYMTTNASSCAISASADPRGAASIQIMIQQRTGSQAVTWTACGSGSGFCWTSGTAPTLTATANAIDIISCFYNPNKDRYYCQPGLDFR